MLATDSDLSVATMGDYDDLLVGEHDEVRPTRGDGEEDSCRATCLDLWQRRRQRYSDIRLPASYRRVLQSA